MINDRVILLVDDSPDDTQLVRRAFLSAGFSNPLHAVRSARAALEYLLGDGDYADRAKFPFPHLLLLDHRMPGMTGWEVLQWVRRRTELRALPVIILSGSDNPSDEKRATDLGANAYVTKPVVFAEFVQAVRRIGEFWLMSPGNLRAYDPRSPQG